MLIHFRFALIYEGQSEKPVLAHISRQPDERVLIPCDVINFHHEEHEGHEEKILAVRCTHLFLTHMSVETMHHALLHQYCHHIIDQLLNALPSCSSW